MSVIVPTYDRSALLRELIESLWKQTLPANCFEIIVVDDCSPDDTAKVLAELEAKSPCRFIWRRNPQNKGPIYSRNIAARMAAAEILAFTDSDCRVSPQWLEEGLAAFASKPDLAFVSGPVLDKPEQPIRFFSLPNGTKTGENPVYPTWNIFYNKAVFWKNGGFDETAWFGNIKDRPIDCSDSDFALKLKDLHYPYRFAANALVYHEVWSVRPFDWLKAFLRMFYIPALMKRHPELRPQILWWGPFLSKENLLFYVGLLGLGIACTGRPLAAVLVLPHLWTSLKVTARRFSPLRLPQIAGQVVFLELRQAVICGSLIYGSLRMRTLVL
ncbi:MAG TPA: glycosyltransferase family A protein [Bryobacteraceae bacterium]|nr:glycosyltransferase family A protein [Bryobacteraceae bacterium]